MLRKNLFKKQLSKHAIGAYMELCREVGESFDAIRSTSLTNELCNKISKVSILNQLAYISNFYIVIHIQESRHKLLYENSISS